MLAADSVVGLAQALPVNHHLSAARDGFVSALHSSALLIVDVVATELAISLVMIAAVIVRATRRGGSWPDWRGQPETAVVTAVAVTMGSGVLLPWGARFQASLVAIVILILATGEYFIEGQAYPTVLAALGLGTMLTTILLSRKLEGTREQLARRARQRTRTRDEKLQTSSKPLEASSSSARQAWRRRRRNSNSSARLHRMICARRCAAIRGVRRIAGEIGPRSAAGIPGA